MNKIFIHTNTKQLLGAKLSQYSFEKNTTLPDLSVELLNVDHVDAFKKFDGTEFVRDGKVRTYTLDDLQSFTLSRFMPPQLMNYQGRAMVIDPDIFALQNVDKLFTEDMRGHAIAACAKKEAWDTSMMVMDCSKLQHWDIESILHKLASKHLDYNNLMQLKNEDQDSILRVPRIWNNLDTLTSDTKIIHTTGRLTQPWKTGLPIDFTINPMQKIFGIIPREPIHKILGKYPTHYKPHPDKKIEKWFFTLVKDALRDGAITRKDIQNGIDTGDLRKDIFTCVERV